LVLESVTGSGSLIDPFIVTERLPDINGGTLSFSVDQGYGNHIDSQHAIGFAIVKIVENGTSIPWASFEIELQSVAGTPSDYGDGLSFGQGSTAGRPFTSVGFDQVTLLDEPYDRIEYDQGKIPIDGQATFRFVVSEALPLQEAYIAQRPRWPVARKPDEPRAIRVGLLPEIGGRRSSRG
jgi:hypothetical protein